MRVVAALLAGLLVSIGSGSAQRTDLQTVLAGPIAIERATPITSAPLDFKMGKLFLNAAANGQSREFIFDTGSPTILSRQFADALGLKPVGKNTGVDANGEAVAMDVALLDSLAIGATTFRNVPVLIFDFAALDMGTCLIDGGIVGSEILPGSAWRIDTQIQRLGIAATATALDGGLPTVTARLHDFGYPHAPIIDYAVGDMKDKALFDTGSAEQVTLFSKVAADASVRKSFVAGSLATGRGYEGELAGGHGRIGDILRFGLSDFRIENQPVGAVRAVTRAAPPSLVGAGMLTSHIVTLDYPGARFLLEKRSEPGRRKTDAGYGIAFKDGHASVVRLFETSAAARAGLKLGDRVTAVQGRSLVVSPDNTKCSAGMWLGESFDPASAADIIVQRDGRTLTIHVPATQAPRD